jgi:L-lactate dehydrogenase (cytochrome)
MEQKLLVGRYDASTAPAPAPSAAPAPTATAAPAPAPSAATATATAAAGDSQTAVAAQPYVKPALGAMLNVFDLEAVAQRVMKHEAWDYYSSGADDEITLRENHSVFHRVWLRPRVLVNVKTVSTACTLLGRQSSMPLYISATALARLADAQGEVALVRAARAAGVMYMLPTLSSCSLDEMLGAADFKQQTLWSQLYVNSNRAAAESYVRRAEAGGCKALFVTVDAPQLGRREKDMRNKFSSKTAGTTTHCPPQHLICHLLAADVI